MQVQNNTMQGVHGQVGQKSSLVMRVQSVAFLRPLGAVSHRPPSYRHVPSFLSQGCRPSQHRTSRQTRLRVRIDRPAPVLILRDGHDVVLLNDGAVFVVHGLDRVEDRLGDRRGEAPGSKKPQLAICCTSRAALRRIMICGCARDCVLDKFKLVGDNAATVSDGLHRLVDDPVRSLVWVRDDDLLLLLDGGC